MESDFVQSLGLPFLAHRLRRVSELIVEGSTAAMARHGFESPARSGSTMLLLLANGPTGITEIAYRLRLSHPLIIKLTAALAKAGVRLSKRRASDSPPIEIRIPEGEKRSEYMQVMCDLNILAFQTDMTRVSTYIASSARTLNSAISATCTPRAPRA